MEDKEESCPCSCYIYHRKEYKQAEANRQKQKKKIRRLKILSYYRSNLFYDRAIALSDDEFVKKYCLTKTLFLNLVVQLSPLIRPVRSTDLSTRCKVLIALTFYATGSYPSRYNTFLTQSSISMCIKEVTLALNNRSILNHHINFPTKISERNEIKAKFDGEYHLLGVIGCIDAFHVAITKPKEDKESHFNGINYSQKVEIVCDYDLNITHVDASSGGALDDEWVFNERCLHSFLKKLSDEGETVHLLGDSDYAQRAYMMTPIKNAPVGSPEELYNKLHTMARNRVNMTMCLLLARWRCLLKEPPLHYVPGMVWSIVNACCILHNICNKARLFPPINLEEMQKLLATERHNKPSEGLSSTLLTPDELQRGLEVRQAIVERFYGRQGNL